MKKTALGILILMLLLIPLSARAGFEDESEITSSVIRIPYWSYIYEDNQYRDTAASGNYVWAASGNGVYRWRIDDYSMTHFRQGDGLISNDTSTLEIDTFGNVWVGTNNGLSVFNGAYWQSFTTANGLTHNQVNTISIDHHGRVLVGTKAGVTIFSNANRPEKEGDPGLVEIGASLSKSNSYDPSGCLIDVIDVELSPSNVLWTAREDAWVCYFDGARWKTWIINDSSIVVDDLEFASNGVLWMADAYVSGYPRGLLRWDPNGTISYHGHETAKRIDIDASGQIWTKEYVFDGTSWKRFAEDRNGNSLEISTDANGYGWVVYPRWITRYSPDGTGRVFVSGPNGTVTKVGFDLEGNPIFSLYNLNRGFLVLKIGGHWRGYNWTNGLDTVGDIAVDADGTIWLGSNEGLNQLVDGVLTKYPTEQYPAEKTGFLHYSDSGDLWVSSRTELSRLKDGAWTHYSTDDGLGSNEILAITSSGNDLWVSHWSLTYALSKFDGTDWITFPQSIFNPGSEPPPFPFPLPRSDGRKKHSTLSRLMM